MANNEETVQTILSKFQTLGPLMNERVKRLWSAAEAKALGYGGISAVSQATGISRTTIHAAIKEIEGGKSSSLMNGLRLVMISLLK